MEVLQKMTKDLKAAATTLTEKEATFLVSTYYSMQENRMRGNSQVRSLEEQEKPHETLAFFAGQSEFLENEIKKALDAFSGASPVGRWARSQMGIGPVLAAGLLAHIDIKKAPTAGHIWSFAGLDPTKEWKSSEDIKKMITEQGKGKTPQEICDAVSKLINRNPENVWACAKLFAEEDGKEVSHANVARVLKMRPFNAELKKLCFKIGESFVKVSNKEDSLYGRLYKDKKEEYIRKNEAGGFAETAKKKLEKFKIGKSTDAYAAYSTGKLPPAHIHAMARRYAVKIFLSHLHQIWYQHEFKTMPPKPFAIAILGHAHMIEPRD